MSRPSASSSEARFLALWALAGLCEAPCAALLLGGAPPVPASAAALLHCAAAALMFFAPPRGVSWLDPERHWGDAAGLWTLGLPGLGWLVIGLLRLLNRRAHAVDAQAADDDEEVEDEEGEVAVATEEETSRRLMEAVDVIPAADILVGSDPTLKRSAIETLARIRTPEAIRWLLASRRDPSPEVRFYATSALTNLKAEYEQRVRAAELEIFEKPTESAPQLAYCRIDYEFARSGLVEGSTRQLVLSKCRSWLKDLSEREEEALRLRYFVERELDPEQALDLLPRLVERLPSEGLRWRKEEAALLFSLGRYAEVAERMKRLGPELLAAPEEQASVEDREWRSAALWWSQ